MAAIDLSGLRFAAAEPIPVTFGTMTSPPQGGEEEAVDRLGDRWSFRLVTLPLRYDPDGMRWSALIGKALKAGAICRVTPPGLILPDYGSPVIATDTAAGKSLPISGAATLRPIRAGQWVSVISGGQRFLDRVTADTMTSATGTATLTIQNLIRKPLTAADVVELTVPKIEGVIRGEVGERWTRSGLLAFEFTVGEAR